MRDRLGARPAGTPVTIPRALLRWWRENLPRLGAVAMLALIIIGQLLTGVVLDTFGWLGLPARPLEPARIMGQKARVRPTSE